MGFAKYPDKIPEIKYQNGSYIKEDKKKHFLNEMIINCKAFNFILIIKCGIYRKAEITSFILR